MRAPAPRPVERLTLAQARRVALAAQGFADRRPTGVPDRRALRRVVGHTALLQIDSVNVLRRAHYLPMFSRLGPYPGRAARARRHTRGRGCCSSTGATRPSCCRSRLQPLLRWRMGRARDAAWGGIARIAASSRPFVDRVLAEIRQLGPVAAGELEHARGRPGSASRAVVGLGEVKRALEYLFWPGEVTARRPTRVRAGLRPARAGAARGRSSRRRRPTRPTPSASSSAIAARRARRGDRARPARLLPAQPPWRRAPRSPSWSRRARCARCRSRAGASRRTLHRDAARAATRRRAARPARTVRPAGLGARAHRAAVRLPLSHRDLRPGAEAGLRLLRAAVPARRPAGRPGRPEGRPAGRRAARPGGVGRSGRAGAYAPTRSPSSCAAWPTGSGWNASSPSSAVIWPLSCRSSLASLA